MSKINLIIQREYNSRVLKKSFLLLTFLTPVLIAALALTPLWLSTLKDNQQKHIYISDPKGLYSTVFQQDRHYKFTYTRLSPETIRRTKAGEKDFGALISITDDLSKKPGAVALYANEQISMELKDFLTRRLNEYLEKQKLAAFHIPQLKEMVESTKTNLNIPTIKWDAKGNATQGSAELALAIGMTSAFIIYMFIVIYGAQVMAGVVQEKTNRIVEVMISSVKPFELMMGKIVGIALVGLTQIILWVVLTGTILVVAASLLPTGLSTETFDSMNAVNPAPTGNSAVIADLLHSLNGFNLTRTLMLFILYFLGGYLLYASLFAAAGSAVDSETDTQQFSFPLTLPIIFAIYAAIYSAQNPDGPLAIWCSMIPFTSPVVMMVRLPYGVPAIQLIASLTILVLSFIGTTWMAGKIYRTGILMYGKKAGWKEIWKWLRYANH